VILALGTCTWIAEYQNVIITGKTGSGKPYLACAFAERACRKGFTAHYVRAPRLLQELAVARGDGSYGRLLVKFAKLDLLVVDDWLLSPLKDAEWRDLLEVIEDRSERGSTLLAGQLPVETWHEVIGEAMRRRRDPGPVRAPRAQDRPQSLHSADLGADLRAIHGESSSRGEDRGRDLHQSKDLPLELG
jgi:hypothetical protein